MKELKHKEIIMETKNELQTIGTVTIEYEDNGEVKFASFTPKIEVPFTKGLIDQLSHITGKNEPEKIREQANLVFGSWFQRVSNIELSDAFVNPITSEVVDCIKYPNGIAKTCIIEFSQKLS